MRKIVDKHVCVLYYAHRIHNICVRIVEMFKIGDRVKFDGSYGVVRSVDNECLCPVTVEFSDGRFKSFPREVFRYLKKVAMIPGDYIHVSEITSPEILNAIREKVKADGFNCGERYGTWNLLEHLSVLDVILVLYGDGDLAWFNESNIGHNPEVKEKRNLSDILEDVNVNDSDEFAIKQVWQTSDGSVFDTIEEAQRNQIRLKLYSVIRPLVDKGLDVTPLR